MKQSTPGWIVLAHLLRPQGRKGEVLAELLTDFPDRFEQQRRVYLAAPGFEGEPAAAREAEVAAYWLPVGRNEGRIVLHFAGVESISDAEPLGGLEVIVPREQRQALDEDAVYISELVGCTVYDGDAAVGIVEDVQFATSADGGRRLGDAAPLLAVRSAEGDEILIPFAKAFLIAVETGMRRIVMKLPAGLVEVNRVDVGDRGVSGREASERSKKR